MPRALAALHRPSAVGVPALAWIAGRPLRALLIACLVSAALPAWAATANDLIGDWVVDGDATWAALSRNPPLSTLSADQLSQAKSMAMTQIAGIRMTFTPDALINRHDGITEQESYGVDRIDGDTIYTHDVDKQGKIGHSSVLVKNGQLVVTNLADPTQVIVLKRP